MKTVIFVLVLAFATASAFADPPAAPATPAQNGASSGSTMAPKKDHKASQEKDGKEARRNY